MQIDAEIEAQSLRGQDDLRTNGFLPNDFFKSVPSGLAMLTANRRAIRAIHPSPPKRTTTRKKPMRFREQPRWREGNCLTRA